MTLSATEINKTFAAASAALNTVADREERNVLWASYLTLVSEFLKSAGVMPEHLAPLVELRNEKLGRVANVPVERRSSEPPSEEILARASAIIDLLVMGSYTEEQAAQKVMRQLLAQGLMPPSEGGDARGWKRLLIWRAKLHHGLMSRGAERESDRLRAEIEAIPAGARIEHALAGRLWDRRHD